MLVNVPLASGAQPNAAWPNSRYRWSQLPHDPLAHTRDGASGTLMRVKELLAAHAGMAGTLTELREQTLWLGGIRLHSALNAGPVCGQSSSLCNPSGIGCRRSPCNVPLGERGVLQPLVIRGQQRRPCSPTHNTTDHQPSIHLSRSAILAPQVLANTYRKAARRSAERVAATRRRSARLRCGLQMTPSHQAE
jgi:hypothetical protein